MTITIEIKESDDGLDISVGPSNPQPATRDEAEFLSVFFPELTKLIHAVGNAGYDQNQVSKNAMTIWPVNKG